MSKPKIIAFYLPQYHPTPDNDKWWGKGFTEWTNVGKAKPLFKGHYQPKVPADLGYYDLRLPEVREAQAELAREAGIYGFCYYHYWFGNGKEELELPFNEVLRLGKPDFPFMLCWANESWHKKFWDKDGKGSSKEVLIEQTYPGEQDIIDHFYRLLPAFKDPRYIRIEDKIAFMIYKPLDYQEITLFIDTWRKLSKKEKINDIYFIANLSTNITSTNISSLLEKGFNAVNTVRLWVASHNNVSIISRLKSRIIKTLFSVPRILEYKHVSKGFFTNQDLEENIIPTIIPNWDHTPRSGKNGYILHNSTPELFKNHAQECIDNVRSKKPTEPLIFLKSWNEWGEGNYMEPDLKWGKEYILKLREILDDIDN